MLCRKTLKSEEICCCGKKLADIEPSQLLQYVIAAAVKPFFGFEHILSAVTRGTSQIRKLTHRCEETMQEYDATVYYCLQGCVRKLRNCRHTHSCEQIITAMGKIHICEGILYEIQPLRNVKNCDCVDSPRARFASSCLPCCLIVSKYVALLEPWLRGTLVR